MAQSSNNNWIWWTLGAVALIGLGVGGYFVFRKPKGGDEKKQDGSGSGDESGGSSNIFTNIGTTITETIGLGGGSSEGATPFTNSEEGNKFRAWVNDNYPDYAKEIDLDRVNSKYDNSTIRKAWAKYGKEYQEKTGGVTTNAPQPSGGGQGANNEGWDAIKKYLKNSLALDKATSYEYTFVMLDVPLKVADYVVHIKEDGNLYFGLQTYGEDTNTKWGKWGFFRRADGSGYWAIEMSNGIGNGTNPELHVLLKNVFQAQYPDVTSQYAKTGDWKNFSDLVLSKKKRNTQGSGDVLDNNL